MTTQDHSEAFADAILSSRWLATRDRAVAQRALRDAADALMRASLADDHAALHVVGPHSAVQWIEDRADALGEAQP